MMPVLLKVIMIDAKVVKPGYVILWDDRLGIVDTTNNKETVIKFPDDTTTTIDTVDAKYRVAKFLAQTEDLRTFPIDKNNFEDLVYHYDTKESCSKMLKHSAQLNGTFVNVLNMPKDKDIVELIDAKFAEQNGLMKNRLARVGVIQRDVDRFKYRVAFANKTHILSREQFSILDRENSKQIFKLNYEDGNGSKQSSK